MHGGTQQHLGANPVLLVSGIKGTLPGQGRVRRSESILTNGRQGIRYSCEAGPFNPFLEAWICLRVLFANHRPVNSVHENPVWPENGLVANACQLCLSPNQRFCGVAQLDRQARTWITCVQDQPEICSCCRCSATSSNNLASRKGPAEVAASGRQCQPIAWSGRI